jgi:hypothetical protein
MTFVSEIETATNFWLRSRDTHTANSFKAFLSETLLFLEGRKTGFATAEFRLLQQRYFRIFEGGRRQKDRLHNHRTDVYDRIQF